MQLRHELANAVIQAIGAKSFLQLGSARALDQIDCAGKQSYFLEAADQIQSGKRYDVVFVDPPHDPGRALFALNVGLEHLSPAGVLLVANVNPAEEWMQEVPASAGVALGQAWRAWGEFRARCGRVTYTANLDHGIGVMLPESRPTEQWIPMDFQTFSQHRASILGLFPADDVLAAVKRVSAPEPTSAVLGMTPEPTNPVSAPVSGDQPETATDPAVPPVTAPRRKRRDRGTP